jgi:hypothetical protein
MKRLIWITFLTIAFVESSYAQICLDRGESVRVAEFVLDCEILEIENVNYKMWVDNQEKKIESMILIRNKLELDVVRLTKKLNDETSKRKKARKSRIVYAIGGVVGGFLIYDFLK